MYYYGAASGVVAAAPFSPLGAIFDGSNDYGTRGADLTGTADGNDWIISCWIYASTLGANKQIFTTNNSSVMLWWDNTDARIELIFEDTGGTQRVIMHGLPSLATGAWHHVLASGDGTNRSIYIDDAAATVSLYGSQTLDFTVSNWAIGATTAGATLWNGRLGELYFNHAEFLDFDTESNRRKFISAGGAPVDLGSDGSVPTGNQPIVYCSYRSGGSPDDFLTNRGSGGGFTVNGALTDGGAIAL